MAVGEILSSILMIFIMIIPGIIFRRKKVIDENQSKAITSIAVNLTWPCLVIDAMQVKFSSEIFHNTIRIAWILLIILAIAFALSFLLLRILKFKNTQGYLFAFMLVFGNTGFIGIPVINALYGKEALFYASIVELVNDILLFTIGIVLIQLSAGIKLKADLKGFLTPGIFGVLIGFVFFLCNFQLPGFLGDSVRIIGAATTPLTMFAIGFQIGGIKIKSFLGDVNIYIMCAMKLIIIPIISLVFVRYLLGDVSLLAKVLIVGMAMPVASCAALFSQQYDGEVEFATKGVLLSTVLSIVTIPVFAVIMG